MAKNVIVGTLVLFLALYSGIIVNFCPLNYLRFFENIAVKIIFLLIIGAVSFFSPLLALFLAIAFLINLEMAHKRQFQRMSNRIENFTIKTEEETPSLIPALNDEDTDRVNQQLYIEAEEKAKMMAINSGNDTAPVRETFISQSNVYDGYTPFASCVNQCQSTNSTNDDLNNECSVVKTWKNQISAQGLQCPTGYSPSMGFPIEE
jgi:hypothetical protein